MIRSKHAVALILVLAFLITVCSLGFAVMVLFQSQHGITHSYIGLDEVRYAEEVGLRHGLWVWRYHYGDSGYFQNQTGCISQPCYIITLQIPNGYTVSGVQVQVEDINNDYKLDIDNDEIKVTVNKLPWSL